MMLLFKKIVNRILKRYQISRIETNEKVVFLTFDDGPEPGICEFVLDELKRYNFKATFFCRGDNAERYPELLQRIKEEGHAIGNHTYSHFHAYYTDGDTYCKDVEAADTILQTSLLRPPHGCLTLKSWLKLRKKYKVIYWSLSSGDSNVDNFKLNNSFEELKGQNKEGNIVLFHFCHRHQKETEQILPLFCNWLVHKGYISHSIHV